MRKDRNDLIEPLPPIADSGPHVEWGLLVVGIIFLILAAGIGVVCATLYWFLSLFVALPPL